LGCIFAAFLLAALPGCHVEQPVPAELMGIWRTSAPAYRDRIFEVRDRWVVFGTGAHLRAIYEIEGVESHTEPGGQVRHILHYWTEEGDRLSVQLIFRPGRKDSLRIGHRNETWVRQRDADWLEEAS
jgi:hypothetical protein